MSNQEIQRLKAEIKERDKKIELLEVQLQNALAIINDFYNKSSSFLMKNQNNNPQRHNIQYNNPQNHNVQNNNPQSHNIQNNNPRNKNKETINDSIIAFHLQEMMNEQYNQNNNNNQRRINNPPIKVDIKKEMSQNEIDRLGTEIYNSRNHYSTNECTFCMDDFKNGDILRRLSCLHVFHKNCIDPWLRKNGFCPIDKVCVEIQ